MPFFASLTPLPSTKKATETIKEWRYYISSVKSSSLVKFVTLIVLKRGKERIVTLGLAKMHRC